MPVEEMLIRTSSAELTEWAAYEQLNGPLGGQRTDVLLAQLCAVVANANRDKKSKKAKPKDFLPQWDNGRGAPQSWQQHKSIAKALNAAFGGAENGRTPPRQGQPRYQVRDDQALPAVIDIQTGRTEWTGLDSAQAREIATEFNTTSKQKTRA